MYIAAARSKGATAVMVTAMNRRHFDTEGHIIETLGDYPQAMRDVAAEQHVPLIDLNSMSKILFETLGTAESEKAFVHFPANTFPNQPNPLKDDTHFSTYGGYELARAIISDIQHQHLPLSRFLRNNIPPFDLSHPDPFVDFHVPPSPSASAEKPYER